jgi:hypothetical protein
MDPVAFDLRLSIPADARLAGMVRDLAVHGVRQIGLGEPDATAFGRRVEEAFREAIQGAEHARISMVIRKVAGPLEVVISSGGAERALAIEGANPEPRTPEPNPEREHDRRSENPEG